MIKNESTNLEKMNRVKNLGILRFSLFSVLFLKTCAKPSIQNYVDLISEVIDKRPENSAVILHSAEDQNMWEVMAIFETSKMFSKKKILSITAPFRNWSEMKSYYFTKENETTRINRPLFVVFCSSDNVLQNFQQISKDLVMKEELSYLMLFIQTNEEHSIHFCMKPVGNPFQLRLGTLMLVKCKDNNTIRAWYTFDSHQMKISTWAIWHPERKFLEMVHEERNKMTNLGGKELTIGIVEASLLTIWDEKTGKLKGYFGEILNALSICMNFTWKLTKKEESYGSWNKTGKFWTAAMGAITAGEVDLMVTDMALDSLRLKSVDFSTILLSSRNLLYVRKPKHGYIVKWLGYFKFLDTRAWGVLILIILITPLLVTLMTMKIRKSYYLPLLLSECYLNIWGIYCQQGLPEFPTELPLRLIYFSIIISALLILNHYSAFVISHLTYPAPEEFLPNLTTFVKDGSYKLIVLRDGVEYNFFEYSKKHPFNAMFKLMMNADDLPTTFQAGIDMVCDQNVGFFINDIASRILSLNVKCDLHQILTSHFDNLAMAFPKGSQYKTEMNRNFRKFTDYGILIRLKRKYFRHAKLLPEVQTFNKVDISEITVLLAIVAGGAVLAVIILLIEKMISFQRKTKRSKTKVKKTKVKRIKIKEFITPENSRKWYNFENQKKNPDRYNKDGELNIKFLKKDYKHKIVLSAGDGKLSFKH